jgi:hypothetical protein
VTDRLLLGIGRWMIPIPGPLWRRLVAANARKVEASLGFMSNDHHRVRDFVVMELPRAGRPLGPEAIAEALELPVPRVQAILDELERRLTFLFRNEDGEVTWAYPVTVDETPHRAHFGTGEDAYSP